jgi:hypothetical protein
MLRLNYLLDAGERAENGVTGRRREAARAAVDMKIAGIPERRANCEFNVSESSV